MVIESVSNAFSRLTGLHMMMAIALLQMNLISAYTKFVLSSQNIIIASFFFLFIFYGLFLLLM